MRSRYRIFLFVILTCFSIAFLANVPTVSAQSPSPTPTSAYPDTNPVGPNGETCGSEVSAVGWILCAIAGGVLKVNDSMWWLAQYLLILDPLQSTSGGHGQQDPVYVAWMAVRDVANVLFVIFFLMIIFSQLTSVGISNYGIKKMLPRLIVCAILVNVSFIVMQLAIDLSNILGKGIYDFLKALAPPLNISWWSAFWVIFTGGLTFGVGAVTIMALTPAVAMWVLIPLALAGLLALIVAILTLIIRTAIIPILAIFAPLAFVAYMFPNTQTWYKKWRDMLVTMLMMYPLAGVVFGGADFAAVVTVSRGPNNFFNNIMGLIILTLPLFSLPFLARQGGAILNAAGGALAKLADKYVQKPVNEYAKSQEDLHRARNLDQDNRGRIHGMYKQMHYNRKNRETETKTRMESHGSRWLSEDARAAELMVEASHAGKQTAIDKNVIAHTADNTARGMHLDEQVSVTGKRNTIDSANTEHRVSESEVGQLLNQEVNLVQKQATIDKNITAHNADNTERGMHLDEQAAITGLRNSIDSDAAAHRVATSEEGMSTLQEQSLSQKQATIDKNLVAHNADTTERGMGLDEQINKGDLQRSIDKGRTDLRVTYDNEGAQLHHDLGTVKLQNERANTEIAHNLETDAGLLELRQSTAAAKKNLSAAQAKTTQITTELASDANLENQESGAVSAETRRIIQNAQMISDVATRATQSAQQIQQGEFQKKVVNADNNPVYAELAKEVGGIDTEHGTTRATAIAASGIERTRSENISAIRSKLKQEGLAQMAKDIDKYPERKDDPKTLLGLARTAPDVETRIAAMQEYAAVANKADMLELFDVAEKFKNQMDKDGNIIETATSEENKIFQQAIGQELVKNKPESATGGMLGNLGSGKYNLTKEEAAITAFEERKYSPATVASMHYGELGHWKDVINEYMTAGAPIPAKHADTLKDMRDKINTAFNDPRINPTINDKQRVEMKEIEAMIAAKYGPTPSTKESTPPTPPPTYPWETV